MLRGRGNVHPMPPTDFVSPFQPMSSWSLHPPQIPNKPTNHTKLNNWPVNWWELICEYHVTMTMVFVGTPWPTTKRMVQCWYQSKFANWYEDFGVQKSGMSNIHPIAWVQYPSWRVIHHEFLTNDTPIRDNWVVKDDADADAVGAVCSVMRRRMPCLLLLLLPSKV